MKKIGKYEVLEKIGVGGFGEVYKAWDPFIKRHVAVKTCTSEDQDTRNRFFQEAEIAGRLNHRNITTVYDFGVEDSLPYLIQEYLSGEDLDRKIKRRDYVPYPEKLHYLIQIARGLAYAHQQGVIHRDVKPANVRVLEDGTVKIMDFGIAKLTQQDTSLTRTGMTVGTAAYLAPEQIRGDPVDHRTDVFSFGVMAYELLTYERPFQGEQISAVIYQILNREPKPIREVMPTAPPEVLELIARCLAKDVKDRLVDGAAVLRFLESVQKKGRGRLSDSGSPGAQSASRATVELPQQAAAPPPATVRQPAVPPPRAAVAEPSPPPSPIAEPPVPESSGASPSLRSPSGETPRQPTLDDLELTSVRLEERTRSRVVTIQGAAAERPSYARYAVLLVLLPVLALAAGWGLGDRDRRAAVTGYLGSIFGQERPAPDGEDGAPEDPPPGEDAPPPGATDSPPAAETTVPPPTGDSPGASTGEGAAEGEAETAPPPPPPEPKPGVLVVSKVEWSEHLTVRVGRTGRRYPLTRDRTFTLPPASYRLTFELAEPDYQASATVDVGLEEDARTRIESPILQPGALSVRGGLGKPQGRVVLSEEDLGETPLRRKKAPGTYPIRIQPLAGEEEGIDDQVLIHAGQETVLTFDLDAGTVSARVKALEKSSPEG